MKQSPNFLILDCNKTQLLLLDPILNQFGVISVGARLQPDSPGAKQTDWVKQKPQPDLHKAMVIWIWMQFDSGPRQTRWENGLWWCWTMFRVRLQIGLEADYQSACLLWWVALFVTPVCCCSSSSRVTEIKLQVFKKDHSQMTCFCLSCCGKDTFF